MKNNKRLIAKIMNGNTAIMTIDQNLMSAEFGALDRGSLTNVADWGIYANRGSLSFIDSVGFFDDQTINRVGLLGYTVKFYLCYNESENIIGTFKVKSATVDEDTREVSVECVSSLEELQTMYRKSVVYAPMYNIPRLIGLSPSSKESRTNLLYSLPFNLKLGEDKYLIENTHIGRAFFGKESAWASLNKICQAGMCRITEDEEGNAEISGDRPQKDAIIINPCNIIDVSSVSFVSAKKPVISVKNVEIGYDLKDVHELLTVNYEQSEEGNKTPTSISGCEYELIDNANGDVSAKIKLIVKTPYKMVGDNLDPEYADEVVNVSAIRMTEHDSRQPDANFTVISERDVSIGKVGAIIGDNLDSIDVEVEIPIVSKKIGDIQYDYFLRALSYDLTFASFHYIENGTEKKTIGGEEKKQDLELGSSDIIDTECIVDYGNGSFDFLWQKILEEVSRRYGKGIECFEIECLFNDYYYEDGELAFSRDDLSTHFKRYDIVVPYVQKRGETVPLRVNEDGSPKKFRVIGISYSYDGLLRQKLQLQEERYDID